VLADGAVTVNGEVETRRGRQLAPGDVITVGDESVRPA
jgi:ribosome-associated protein